ncbi:MAG TPA: hypothetical protein VK694_00340 [Verrucomicrobiae bacterium]|nr:hypothetical protein [Verrucomicrobiae bacterium]
MAMTSLETSTGSLPAFTEAQLELADMTFNPMNRREATPEVMGTYLTDIYGRELCQDRLMLTGALAVDAFISVPISEEQLTDMFSGIEADIVADGLEGANSRTKTQIQEALAQSEGVPDEKKLMAVSDALAQKAYEGVFRKTGSTHHSHAFAAAAMAHHVFGKLRTEGHEIDPVFEETVVSLLLLHDAGEETMRASKHFDPNRTDSYHSLLVKRIFERMGNDYASDAADAMRYMTHLKERPWMPSYMDYILIGTQSLLFCQVKPYDIQHNHEVEPKPVTTDEEKAKRAHKWEDYDAAKSFLELNAMLHAKNREDRDAIKRSYEHIARIRNAPQVAKMVTRLQATIYTENS